jgi:hypothetical protein
VTLLIDTAEPQARAVEDRPVVFDRAAAGEQLRAKVRAAISEEIERFTPEKIVEGIIAQVRKGEREVIWKILGMDNRWGGAKNWEIDHCNGRISPLSEELAERCKPLLTDAVAEIAREVVAEMTVDPEARATLKRAFKKELQEHLHRITREHVRTTAEAIAKETVGGIVTEVKAEAGL